MVMHNSLGGTHTWKIWYEVPLGGYKGHRHKYQFLPVHRRSLAGTTCHSLHPMDHYLLGSWLIFVEIQSENSQGLLTRVWLRWYDFSTLQGGSCSRCPFILCSLCLGLFVWEKWRGGQGKGERAPVSFVGIYPQIRLLLFSFTDEKIKQLSNSSEIISLWVSRRNRAVFLER